MTAAGHAYNMARAGCARYYGGKYLFIKHNTTDNILTHGTSSVLFYNKFNLDVSLDIHFKYNQQTLANPKIHLGQLNLLHLQCYNCQRVQISSAQDSLRPVTSEVRTH